MYASRRLLGLVGCFTRTCRRPGVPKRVLQIQLTSAKAHSSSSGKPGYAKFIGWRVSVNGLALIAGSLLLFLLGRKSGRSRVVPSKSKKEAVENVVNHLRFTGKVVLITGAAGDIGAATAKRFAHEGATVILVDLPSTKNILEAKCIELKEKAASDVFFVTADVTKEEEVIKMVESVRERAGPINCFFNNAGVQGRLCPLHEQKEEDFQLVSDVNIRGVFLCLKYVSQAMMADKAGGVIVNTASLAGLIGPANMAAYVASKFAVVGMTKTAAKDLAQHGIRVCAIAPGLLEGKMWSTQIKGNAECQKRSHGDTSEVTIQEIKEQEARMINGTPLKRLGELSEVASVVAFLCSDDASYVTGVVLPVDGGRLQ